MGKRIIFFLGLLFVSIVTMAQTKVTGSVTDDQGDPVIGASIKVVGTNTGTITNTDGEFSLTVPNQNSKLEISYIGMASQTLRAQSNMRIQLRSLNNELDEVMVVAYGTAKKSAYTGAATQIKADKIENRQISNISSALVGTASGVQTLQTSGQPGTRPRSAFVA